MKIIKKVNPNIVYNHWEMIDTNDNSLLRDQMVSAKTEFFIGQIERKDLKNINIIYSTDWLFKHKLALNGNKMDFSINNVTRQYKKQRCKSDNERVLEILSREAYLKTKKCEFPVILTHNMKDFTIMEGNRRCVALNAMSRLVGQKVYIGTFDINIYSVFNYKKKIDTNIELNERDMLLLKQPRYKVAWINTATKEIEQREDLGLSSDQFWMLHKDANWKYIIYETIK